MKLLLGESLRAKFLSATRRPVLHLTAITVITALLLYGTLSMLTSPVRSAAAEGYANPQPTGLVVGSPTSSTTSTTTTTTVTASDPSGSTAVISMPPTALPPNTNLAIAPVTNNANLAVIAPAPSGSGSTVVAGFTVNATSNGQNIETLSAPAGLTFSVPATAIPAGTNPANLVLAFWNGSSWEALPSTVTIGADGKVSISGVTSHLTLFGVLTATPVVVPNASVPPPGGFVLSRSGTNDPVKLAAAQTFQVFAIYAGPNLSQIYIPGSPTFVQTLNTSTLKLGDGVLFRRSGEQAPPAAGSPSTVTVQAGEWLSAIGARYGIAWPVIAELNGVKGPDYIIQPGQVLRLR